MLTVAIASAGVASAASYDLEFLNGVAVPGGGACTLNLNDRCRFSNVVIGAGTGSANPFQRDIVVTISKLTTATLGTFDNPAPALTTPPTPVATPTQFFAPSVQPPQGAANTIGWAEFTFDLVLPGGAVPTVGAGTATLPGNIWASSFDTDSDGGTLREFVEFVGVPVTDTALATPTNLSIGTAVNGGVQYQSGAASGANIITDPAFKVSVVYTNPASFKLVYGARTGASGSTAGPRLTAFDFFRPDAISLRPVVDGYKSAKLTTDADNSGSVTAGDTVTWDITYVNTGNADVTNFQITDALPGNVTFTMGNQTVTPGTGSTATKNTLYAGTGNLLAGAAVLAANSTIRVSIPVEVGVSAVNTTLSNQASAGGTAAVGPNPSGVLTDNTDNTTVFPPSVTAADGWTAVPASSVNQTAATGLNPTTVAVVNRQADLAIDKSGPAAVGSGGSISYALRVWNNGPNTTSGVTVSDTIPTGFTVTGLTCAVTGTATCGTQTFTSSSVSITTGNLTLDTTPANALPDGNFLTYTLAGTAPANGSLSNTAGLTVPAGTADNVAANNTSAAVVTRVIDAVNDATATFTQGSGGTVSVLGNDTNGSVAATATNSVVTVTNNGGLTNLTVNAAGQLVVPAATLSGIYNVTYKLCDNVVTTACDTATVQIVVVSPPAITLLKLGRNTSVLPSQPFIGSAGSIGVKPGETVEYCIVYSNTGGVASNLVLQDYVPVGMVAQLAAYGTSGPGGTGDPLGLKYAAGVALAVNDADSNAVTPTLTSKSGDDVGTLSTVPVTNPGDSVGSPQRPGLMTLTLPIVAANSKGTVCFQARVP